MSLQTITNSVNSVTNFNSSLNALGHLAAAPKQVKQKKPTRPNAQPNVRSEVGFTNQPGVGGKLLGANMQGTSTTFKFPNGQVIPVYGDPHLMHELHQNGGPTMEAVQVAAAHAANGRNLAVVVDGSNPPKVYVGGFGRNPKGQPVSFVPVTQVVYGYDPRFLQPQPPRFVQPGAPGFTAPRS
jgi:hypothetical protein